MKKHGIELVCFDLNKTLIEETTWDNLNVALGMTREEDQHYVEQFAAGKITYAEWIAILLDIYKQKGKATLQLVSESVSKYTYKEGAEDLIRYLKEQGYQLALISGSLDILVDRVSSELNIGMAKSNNVFVFDADDRLQDITTLGEDDMAKLSYLESFRTDLGIDITQCVCVGDGDNDIKLFEKTQHGITFVGSKIESSAWRTIRRLEDIKLIL